MAAAPIELVQFDERDDYPLMEKGPDCPFNNETFNLWGYDAKQQVGFNIHLVAGGGDLAHFNATILLYVGNEIYASEYRGAARPDGVETDLLRATVVEPLKHWTYRFEGPLRRTDAVASRATEFSDMPAVDCAFEWNVQMVSPPIEQGTQGDDGVRISSGTIARSARRYEQLARITGPVRIGNRTIELDALGMRVHRRNSAGIYESGVVGHTWLTGVFPSGRGFHACAYRNLPDAEIGFCHAFYFDGENHVPADVIEMPHYSGRSVDDSYRLTLAAGGQRIEIEGLPSTPYLKGFKSRQMDRILFSRAPGHFRMDGEVGGGVCERSLSADYSPGGQYQADGG